MSGMQENKKQKNPTLPSACTRQSWAFFPAEPSIAECWRGTRQSDQTFTKCQHSAKAFFKKIKSLPSAPRGTRQRIFQKKNNKSLPSA
jgi:hypothetical protein